MHTHIGQGVGKFIDEELFKAKNYVKVCSPNISYSLCKKLFGLLDNHVEIKVITSDIFTGDKKSKQANDLAKETIKRFQNNSEDSLLEYKVISTKDIPMIHAKIFVIDGKCAIMGSANFTENSFQNFAEYILISDDEDMVKRIENDYDKLWLEVNSFPNQIKNNSIRKFLKKI